MAFLIVSEHDCLWCINFSLFFSLCTYGHILCLAYVFSMTASKTYGFSSYMYEHMHKMDIHGCYTQHNKVWTCYISETIKYLWCLLSLKTIIIIPFVIRNTFVSRQSGLWGIHLCSALKGAETINCGQLNKNKTKHI